MLDNSNHPKPLRWQVTLVASVFLSIAAWLLYDGWRSGQPIALPDATHDKLECASYTPSHNGHTLGVVEKRALVANDLRILAGRFRCVRTYSVSEGLDEAPRVARELGLKVMLGLWISSHAPSNDEEIRRGIELANTYQDVVTAVIIGNEVLLRRELTAPKLRELIGRVKAGTRVPVTYADVWEFWLRNPDLAQTTDFVTIHILPYWEDHPIDIDRALDHVQSIYRKVQEAFPGKRVFIGETGWPSAGRPRLNAVPSRVNAARFIREFVAYAEREGIPYNLIEAFDQPWKRIQEGTVGGYWGLYDANGEPKFAFEGPIVGDPQFQIGLIAALIGALAAGLIGKFFLRPQLSMRGIALLALAGYIGASLLYRQWNYLAAANRTTLEWCATLMWASFGWLAYFVIAHSLARWLDGAPMPRPLSIGRVVANIGYGAQPVTLSARVLGVARAAVLFGLGYAGLSLVYDGRGRDFPLALVALPAMSFMMLEWLAPRERIAAIDREETLFAVLLVVSAAFVAYRETALNLRALAWAALCAAWGIALALEQWRLLHPHERTQQQPDAAQFERI